MDIQSAGPAPPDPLSRNHTFFKVERGNSGVTLPVVDNSTVADALISLLCRLVQALHGYSSRYARSSKTAVELCMN